MQSPANPTVAGGGGELRVTGAPPINSDLCPNKTLPPTASLSADQRLERRQLSRFPHTQPISSPPPGSGRSQRQGSAFVCIKAAPEHPSPPASCFNLRQ